MTLTEKKMPIYNVNDIVYIMDNEIYDTETCIRGMVTECGDETIVIKWDDLPDETEYELADMPKISFLPIATLQQKYESVRKFLTEAFVVFESMARYPEQYPLWDEDKSKNRYQTLLKILNSKQ